MSERSPITLDIEREATRQGRNLRDEERDRLETFFSLLSRWGKRIRLTGSREAGELVWRHLGDALALDGALSELEQDSGRALGPCLDVGSGGGLPALPLLALNPRRALSLVEARGRKAAFLRMALFELGFSAQVYDQRLERLLEGEELSIPFDAVWSLATFSPEEWLERATSLVAPGGYVFVFMTTVTRALIVPRELQELSRSTWQRRDGHQRWLISYERQKRE